MLDFKKFMAESREDFARMIRPNSSRLDVSQRLAIGWKAEEFVVSVIRKMLGPVQVSSEAEDRGAMKIDARITNQMNGQTLTAQIKSRESRDDIPVEWFRVYPHVPGRDQVGQAQLYVTMNPDRSMIYMISSAAIKDACKKLVSEWQQNFMRGKFQYSYETSQGKVVLLPSRDVPGAEKLMVYLKPDAFRSRGVPGWPTAIIVPDNMRSGTPAVAR